MTDPLTRLRWGNELTRQLVEHSKERIELSLKLIEQSERAVPKNRGASVHLLTQDNADASGV